MTVQSRSRDCVIGLRDCVIGLRDCAIDAR